MLRELQDRVADDLARAVVGDVAATIRLNQRDALALQIGVRDQQVPILGSAAQRVGMRVFDEYERIANRAGRALPRQRALALPRGEIVHPAGLEHLDCAGGCFSHDCHADSIAL